MRLISNFKDYYDGLQDPTDKHHVYARLRKNLGPRDEVTIQLSGNDIRVPDLFEWAADRKLGQADADRVAKEWNGTIVPEYVPPGLRGLSWKETSYSQYRSVILLFCGKLYRGVRYVERWSSMRPQKESSSWENNEVSRVYWTYEDFRKDHRIKERKGLNGKFVSETINASELRHFESSFKVQEENKWMDLNFLTGCPVIAMVFDTDVEAVQRGYGKGAWVAQLNPCLKDFQFFRFMEAPIAFQELSMFIGGVLSVVDKPERVDDRYKITAHGFDLQESFRKAPTKEHR